MKNKYEITIEKAKDNQLWGHLKYGEDLLTTNAKKPLMGSSKISKNNLGHFII